MSPQFEPVSRQSLELLLPKVLDLRSCSTAFTVDAQRVINDNALDELAASSDEAVPLNRCTIFLKPMRWLNVAAGDQMMSLGNCETPALVFWRAFLVFRSTFMSNRRKSSRPRS